MFKSIFAVVALFLGLTLTMNAQEAEGIKFAKWTDGSGYSYTHFPWMETSKADTSVLVEFADYISDGDTLKSIVPYTTADTAQAGWLVLYYSDGVYLGTSIVDSLVYGFNTDKLIPADGKDIHAIAPIGTTGFKVIVTETSTYNMDGDEGRLGLKFVVND